MKNIPFRPELIEAILAGHKTETRRLAGGRMVENEWTEDTAEDCHYGKPGDILFVKEPWRISSSCVEVQYRGRVRKSVDVTAKWMSRRSMPEWAARLFLRIVSVRIEPVQSIDLAGAQAEGMLHGNICFKDETPRQAFERIWDNIHQRGSMVAKCLWKDNPEVFVIAFEVVGRPPTVSK